MRLRKNWFPVLLVVAVLLTALTASLAVRPAQNHLRAAAEGRLVGAGLEWAVVAMRGRDAVVSGNALSSADKAEALRMVAATPGIRTARDAVGLLPEMKPYHFEAARRDSRLVLSGAAPGQHAAVRLIEAAQRAMPVGTAVESRLTLARGAPEGYGDLVAQVLVLVQALAEGRVSAADRTLSLEGRAQDDATYEALSAIRDDRHPGYTIGHWSLQPPVVSPFVWSARRDGDSLVVTGHRPPTADMLALLAQPSAPTSGIELRDQTRPASQAPPNFSAQATFAFGLLLRLDPGRAEITDGRLTVGGTALDPVTYASIMDGLARRLPPGTALADLTLSPPVVRPYRWTATRDGLQVVLGGYAADAEERAAVAKAANDAFPGLTVSDRSLVADGAPAGFRAQVDFAIGVLAGLKGGEVAIEGDALSVKGVAASVDGYEALRARLAGTLPEGLRTIRISLAPAVVVPYLFSAELNGEEVLLGGYVPSDSGRAAAAAEIADLMPTKTLRDQRRIADGAPPGFAAARDLAMRLLSRLASGRVAVDGLKLTLNGAAASPADYRALVQALAAPLPAGFAIADAKVSPAAASPYAWQAERTAESIRLTGYLPGEDLRAAMRGQLSSLVPQTPVADETLVAGGAPPTMAQQVEFALSLLPMLSQGTVRLRDSTLDLTGTAGDAELEARLRERLSGALPEGLQLGEIRILPPQAAPDRPAPAAQ